MLTLYALEGLLARFAASPYHEDFVLKGGVLLAAFSLRWASWRRRQSHAHALPEQFSDALNAVAAFTDPVLDSHTPDEASWNPGRQTWEIQIAR
ncbi:MAG TPA: hypothetical protein VHC49_11010 [Mycobacteriales bacterium]|nr:hypothetical protein [Mycobacteriales bacterium]